MGRKLSHDGPITLYRLTRLLLQEYTQDDSDTKYQIVIPEVTLLWWLFPWRNKQWLRNQSFVAHVPTY